MSEGYTKESKPEPTAMTLREQRYWALGKVVLILVVGMAVKFGWISIDDAKRAIDAYPMSQEPAAKQAQPDQPKALSDDQPTPAPTLLPVAQIDVIDVAGKSLDVSTGTVEVPPNIPVIVTASNSVRSTLAWGRTKAVGHVIAIPDGFVLVPSPGESVTFFLAVQSGDVLATTQLLVTCQVAPMPPPDDEPKPIPDNSSKTILQRLDGIEARLAALEKKPKPVPDVEPDPVVNEPLRVLIIREGTDQNHTRDQLVVLHSTKLAAAMDRCTVRDSDGRPGWRKWDKDTDASAEIAPWPDIWAAAKPKAIAAGLPVIAIIKGKVITIHAIQNEAQAVALVEASK